MAFNAENPQMFLPIDYREMWYLCGLLNECGDEGFVCLYGLWLQISDYIFSLL